ncbi:uncharacterized protein ACWYII_000030 isoform 1-T3 [Salvelinus alpinus]
MAVLLCGGDPGSHGSVTVWRDLPPRRGTMGQLCATHYPALAQTTEETVNVSGVGDCLAGGITAGMFPGRDAQSCVKMGLLATRLSLPSPHPTCPTLTTDYVEPNKVQPPQPWP